MMRVGLAADHGGLELKTLIARDVKTLGHEVRDFGATELDPDDDYPDFVIPLAHAVSSGEVDRGIAVCGSGVGACIAANKVDGVRASLINDTFSAHQGVEDDDMNVICLGGRVVTLQIAREYVHAFLNARFKGKERFKRRLEKITQQAKGRA